MADPSSEEKEKQLQRLKAPARALTVARPPQKGIPSSRLSAGRTPEETEFKRKVYERHCQHAARNRPYCEGISASRLATVENGHEMRKDAASACNRMFRAMRDALATEQTANVLEAKAVTRIVLSSGYRSPDRD